MKIDTKAKIFTLAEEKGISPVITEYKFGTAKTIVFGRTSEADTTRIVVNQLGDSILCALYPLGKKSKNISLKKANEYLMNYQN